MIKNFLSFWMLLFFITACTVVIEQPPEEEPDEEPPIEEPIPDPIPTPEGEVMGEVYINPETGLFDLIVNTSSVMSIQRSGWGPNFVGWGGWGVTPTLNEDGSYTAVGDNGFFEFNEVVNVRRITSKEIEWDFTINTRVEKDSQGAALEFHLNHPDLVTTMLPDNQGFTMKGFQPYPEQEITVSFSGDWVDVNFERPANTANIRAYFLMGTFQPDEYMYTMKVSLPEDMYATLSPTERLGSKPDGTWIDGEVLINYFDSPIDLSYMNADEIPAGKRGWLKVVDGNFQFDDGTPVRFWGTNLSAGGIFNTSDEDIVKHAKRISKLGYNMVRLHHHDSYWVNPTIYGNPNDADFDPHTIDPRYIDKVDKWIKAFKDEGIYVWLDLEVQRPYTVKDNLTLWDEIEPKANDSNLHGKYITGHGYNYIDEDIQELQKKFMTDYLTHVNPYTGLAYVDDPAVAWIQFYNENDLTNHFGNMFLPNYGRTTHSEFFMGEAEKFALENNLSITETKQTWTHGTYKLFANEMEYRNNKRMREHALSLGFKGIMSSTSQWAAQSQASLPALAAEDIVDVHTYGNFNDVSKNPRYVPSFTHYIGASQVGDLPVSISEWNIESVNNSYDRFVSPIQVATQASHQEWDLPMEFGYGGGQMEWRAGNGTYSSYGDPVMISSMGVGAIMYREGHVSPAKETYVMEFPYEDYYGTNLSPKSSSTIRTLMEQYRVVTKIPEHPSLPWSVTNTSGDKVVTNPHLDFIPSGQDYVQFDTGEVTRNWKDGTLVVDTPRSQSISGWIGVDDITTTDITVTMDNSIGSVAVQSLDDNPITTSGEILISLASRTEWVPSQKVYVSEPINGIVNIKAVEGMTLYKLDKVGNEIPLTADHYQWESGYYNITLNPSLETYWLKLK